MASVETEADEAGGGGDAAEDDYHTRVANGSRHVQFPELLTATRANCDVLDEMPPLHRFTFWDSIVLLFSIVSYLIDIGTDAALAYFYWHDDHVAYFGLTIAFVIIPSMTVTGISLSWYFADARIDEEYHCSKSAGDSKTSHTEAAVPHWAWVIRVTMHILQLAPVIRYIESIAHGLRSAYYRSNRRKRCFKQMVFEDADASLLRLFEAFMESAPQLVLQMYILARNAQTIRFHYIIGFRPALAKEQFRTDELQPLAQPGIGKEDPFLWQSSAATVIFQGASLFTSLVSLAWALTSYQRLARYTMPDKKNMTITGTIFYFLWRLGLIASRILALALFASVFSFWVGLVCFIRWIATTAWLVAQKKHMYETWFQEMLFSAALGVMYNFTYVNVRDEPTYLKVTVYYTTQFFENSILVALWFVYGDRYTWFYYPALVIQVGCFWLGIAFMVLYYTNFHPNGPQPISSCTGQPRETYRVEADTRIPRDVFDFGIKGLRRASHRSLSQALDQTSF